MSKKGGSAPEPDPRIGEAALKQAELGEDWLRIAQEQFAISNKRDDAAAALAAEVTQQQLEASRQAQQWATEDRARYKDTFQPLEDKFIAEADKYSSQAYQDDAAAKARADVMSDTAQARGQSERSLSAMGVNPASGRFAGMERGIDLRSAVAAVGAANTARQTARDKGLALTADALNIGRGLPAQAASSLGLGVQSGSAAFNTTAGANQIYNQSLGILQGGYNTAMQGYAGMGSGLNALYGNQLNAWQAQQQASSGLLGSLGQIAGVAASFIPSSKDLKTDKRPARGVLAAVEKMPVEEWTYKDGVADGGRHIGPYAEDFKRLTGRGNGKSISVVDGIGVALGAVKELAAKVDTLEKRAA
jgi:hypothetical protein